ncbi:hypothetical protein LTR08_008831 [Meristemomyces frigidus]|nr:hypothetical protein LTR08_008831 [Meristemomyces frigidus]
MGTVAIGASEVRHVSYSQGDNEVYTEGSSTDISNGQICIAYKDYKGAKWFIDMISQITKDATNVKHMPEDKLNHTFSNQCNELRKAWDKVEKRASEQRRRAQQKPASDDDQRILYESDQPPRKSLHKRMQGGEDEDDESSRTATKDGRQSPKTLHYFQDHEPLRRTTQQMIPVTQRYPSQESERWFRLNQPKR